MTTTTELTLFADYFQIHVSDADADGDLSDAWTEQAVADCLAVRVRVSRSNLARAARADIHSDESPETTEKIRIQAWPAPKSPTKVMKRWP
ncbi:hypothetical protein [Streptomyces sp. NPDC001194]|uniref:hypothetical protein n=1 Tax=Streptomyces sp. NPDC001194 TaxID=3364547 RepID=UPI0036981DF7